MSEDETICIQLSPWGGFFVWIAKHVERLRREHRVVGHPSVSANGSSSSSANSQNAPTLPVDLPLQLSLEETSLLLSRGIAKGIYVAKPVIDLPPPSIESLMKFDEACVQNQAEGVEILRLQKRQRMLGYYSEIVQGAAKRTSRKNFKLRGDSMNESDPLVDGNGFKMSKNRLKRLQRKKRRKVIKDFNDSIGNYLDDEDNYDFYNNDGDIEGEGSVDETGDGRMPTIEELTAPSSSKSEAGDDDMMKFIPVHRPRPTPKEWRRPGEHTLLSVPLDALVSNWLLDLLGRPPCPDDRELVLLRCRVFADLWSRGSYITCGATKMGGDLLVYQGDPLFYHASHIVLVRLATSRLHLSRLSACLRIANSVRKALVVATESSSDEGILYCSLYWTGSRQQSQPVL